MISFMFAVLGSVIFWAVWGSVSFIAGANLFRHMCPKAYACLLDSQCDNEDRALCAIALIAFVIAWLPILVVIGIALIVKAIFEQILGPVFVKAVKLSTSIIPEFEIKRKDGVDD